MHIIIPCLFFKIHYRCYEGFFSFWWYWGLNSGLALARHVVYHLSHSASLPALVISETGSCFMHRSAWTRILFVLPNVAGMTGAPQLCPAIGWNGSQPFLSGLAYNENSCNLCLPSIGIEPPRPGGMCLFFKTYVMFYLYNLYIYIYMNIYSIYIDIEINIYSIQVDR
jgi:hypothetical protein